jgi:hypothetical protein
MAVLLLVIILVIVVPVEIALKRWEERVYG